MRELVRAELIETLRAGQILEAVLAQVVELELSGDQVTSRLTENRLATVSGGHDPRRPVDVHPDVVLCDKEWLTGVDADADMDGALIWPAVSGEQPVCLRCSRSRSGSGLESDEERVALAIDLVATVLPERLPHQPSVF